MVIVANQTWWSHPLGSTVNALLGVETTHHENHPATVLFAPYKSDQQSNVRGIWDSVHKSTKRCREWFLELEASSMVELASHPDRSEYCWWSFSGRKQGSSFGVVCGTRNQPSWSLIWVTDLGRRPSFSSLCRSWFFLSSSSLWSVYDFIQPLLTFKVIDHS